MLGFNPKSFSDDQLLEKHNELMSKIAYMSKFSSNNSGIDMMYKILDMIIQEKNERIMMENWKMASSYIKKTIETDPDLANPDRKKQELEPKKKSKRANLPARTSEPVIDISLDEKKE